nr:hypothetical protein [Tanacetum cinerariifolium]
NRTVHTPNSTGQIPPKKSRVKGSQGKKNKKTASRRVVKKKVTISIDDNIIPDPDVDLELCKSISVAEAEAEEEEATNQVCNTSKLGRSEILSESVTS